MKKLFNIGSFFITLAFLISAGGIYFVKHTCLSTGHTTLLLDRNHNCCEYNEGEKNCCDHATGKGTCPVEGEHENCCSNSYVYLKGEFDFAKTESHYTLKKINFKLFYDGTSDLLAKTNYRTENHLYISFYNPPRDVLIRNNILIL